MDWLVNVITASWQVWQDTAVYVLAGFALAGVIHVWGVGNRLLARLTRPDSRSVLISSFIGLPLPLCSCGVLPTAIALHRRGAAKGAVAAFLIAGPEISIPAILLTYAMLGTHVAIVRVIAAFVTAIAAGLVVNLVERRLVAAASKHTTPSGDAGTDDSGDTGGAPSGSANADAGPDACCGGARTLPIADATAAAPASWWQRLTRFAFVELFDEIAIWLVVGVVLAGVIMTAMPGFLLEWVLGGTIRPMIVMLLVGVPLYVCATSSTPIAAALVAQGVSPGAALVFLLAGPATNASAIGILTQQFGRRIVAAYLAVIAVVAVVMGLALNVTLAWWGVDLAWQVRATTTESAAWWQWAGSIVMLSLLWRSFRRARPGEKLAAWLATKAGVRMSPRTPRRVLVAGLAAWYVGSGFVAIEPGEVGIVRRFGRAIAPALEPGPHYRWPWPIEAVDRVPVDGVQRVTIGFRRTSAAQASAMTGGETAAYQERPDESWTLSGDENIVDVKAVVQFCVRRDAVLDYAYRQDDPPRLVRAAALAVIREVFASQRIDAELTEARPRIEADVFARLQSALDGCGGGVRLVSFCLVDVHAPPDVHDAFRDVASAVEDKATAVNLARVDAARVVPTARGQADRDRADAEAYADRAVNQATGRASRFVQRLDAYRTNEAVTRLRLYLDTLDAVLPKLRKIIRPPADTGADVEVWFWNGAVRTQPQLSGDAASARPSRSDNDVSLDQLKELLGP